MGTVGREHSRRREAAPGQWSRFTRSQRLLAPLLLLGPLVVVLDRLDAAPALTLFVLAAVALVPLSWLSVDREGLARFFLDSPLGRRDGFETLVRYRLAAFDRETEGAGGQAGLRPLDGRELLA